MKNNYFLSNGPDEYEMFVDPDGNDGWGFELKLRGKYRHFVRECHRRGLVVLQDVVYNHYDPEAERAEWQYDSTAPEQNIYYWYEGKPSDYSSPDSGYLDIPAFLRRQAD